MILFSEKITKTVTYDLTPDSIDMISREIEDICRQNKTDSRTAARYRLSVEESLGKWLKGKEDGSTKVTFEAGKKFFKKYLKISSAGEQNNPYISKDKDELFGTTGNSLLMNIGLVPEYSYRNGENSLVFNLQKRQKNQVLMLLLIISASVLLGLSGLAVLPANVVSAFSQSIIAPVEDAFFRVLSALAGPMIFLSVIWGVYGIGDVYTLGKIGKKLMTDFLKVIFAFGIFGCLFYKVLGPELSAGGTAGNQFSKIFEMILGVFPSNIISPFTEGNTLQIIFLAFIIGLSMIFLGQRTSSVAKAVEQINHIINFLMGFISKLVPYFVFIVLINLIWSGSFNTFKSVWKFAVVFILIAFAAHILFLLFVSVTAKQSPVFLLKSVLPSYLIALSTASSSATFESNISICNNKFKINKELSSFGTPFGMVIFKPTTAIYYLLICFYFASAYNVNVSVSWIVTALIVTAVSAVATPPIPGGAAATYTILFLQLGIPSSALALVLAIDMIFDFLLTSGDMYMLLLELYRISEKTGMHKREKNKRDIVK